jgi:hypothetical protein
VAFRARRDSMKEFHPQNENYPQILGINADFFFSLRSLRLCGSLFAWESALNSKLQFNIRKKIIQIR